MSIYKCFPSEGEDISQKYQVLNLFMTLLKRMPDLHNSVELLTLLIVKDGETFIDNKMVNLLEEMKRKVLKRDRVCEPVLENLRQYFTQLLPEMIESREEIINPVAVRQYNFLVDMTFKFLDYLENHKKYQARCSKITSSIHNIVRNEIETIQKESKEMIVGIFSLIDDLCEDKDKVWDPFVEIMENATLKNNTPEDQWISKLENLVMEKDLYFLMQRHSLFDLEKKGVIKNFSFDKGSKFFDM